MNAHLFVAAGSVVSYWLGGFDERVAAQRPGLVTILAAVEQAYALGNQRLCLGPGDQEYKYRFAVGEERLEWVSLVPAGRGSLRVRQRIAATRLKGDLADRLPAQHRALVKRLLRKPRARRP